MSCGTSALPALAALLASGASAFVSEGGGVSPETPKETKGWQQLQPAKGGAERELALSVAPRTEDTAASDDIKDKPASPSATAAFVHTEKTAAAGKPVKGQALETARECPAVKEEVPAPQQQNQLQQQEQQQQKQQEEQQQNQQTRGHQTKTDNDREQADEDAFGGGASSVSTEMSVSGQCSSSSSQSQKGTTTGPRVSAGSLPSHPRRGSDRSGEWHPLDAVVERIESHVRPGAGGQRLQWSKGFRMPLGAEGRQILLRRLRKAYHSNPVRFDEELARHRIVFSRMPYATVIELFHLAHLLGVFDFAVKCSEEYGNDSTGGSTHRKRRPVRSAAASAASGQTTAASTASTSAQQQGIVGETAIEDGVGSGSVGRSTTQGKRSRRSPSLYEGSEVQSLQSARPKRSRRFSPAYLRDYEMLAESFRLPPPSKRGRPNNQSSTSAATGAANPLESWNCSKNIVDFPRLQPQNEDLLAAALGGRDCASAHDALFRAGEEQTAEAASAGDGVVVSAPTYSCNLDTLQQSGSGEFNDQIWGWGTEPTAASDIRTHLSLCERNSLSGTHTEGLGGSLEGELRDLSVLLQQEQQQHPSRRQQQHRETDLTSGQRGRVFFSAELPAGGTEGFEAVSGTGRRQNVRSGTSNRSSNNGATQQRKVRRVKTKAPGSAEALVHSLSVTATHQQPSLADLLVGQEAGTTAAGASVTEGPKSQLNLNLLTTNCTIAAQYLQVIELLAVQRQIMELTQSLNKKRIGLAAAPDPGENAVQTPKLDHQSLLNQQLILKLGTEAGLTTTALHQAQQTDPSSSATQASILKDIQQKVAALESLAVERSAAASGLVDVATKSTHAKPTPAAGDGKVRRDLSRQSALSCSAPESPVDGYESAGASPCCSGSSSSSCNTPDSLASERLLLLSSLWQPLPPAEGLAGANL